MSGKNKNQTATERARAREVWGAVPSSHMCASPTCPNAGKPIAMGELYPVMSLVPLTSSVQQTSCPNAWATPVPFNSTPPAGTYSEPWKDRPPLPPMEQALSLVVWRWHISTSPW